MGETTKIIPINQEALSIEANKSLIIVNQHLVRIKAIIKNTTSIELIDKIQNDYLKFKVLIKESEETLWNRINEITG